MHSSQTRMMRAQPRDSGHTRLSQISPELETLRTVIDAAWESRDSLSPSEEILDAIRETLDHLTTGVARAAQPDGAGGWTTNDFIKKAILLHFRVTGAEPILAGAFEFFDKVPLQGDWSRKGVRALPGAIVRHGAHVAPGVVLCPSFVNIGARIGPGTMIDTWATVGSCAQIGARCHISGGAGIGGVLEPVQAAPVIIEDNCFIGARCEVAEGVRVGEGAVLAMGCYIGQSTRVYNALTGETTRGAIPSRAVVVPGALPSADGSHSTYALIIKKFRDAQTDVRTALNDILR